MPPNTRQFTSSVFLLLFIFIRIIILCSEGRRKAKREQKKIRNSHRSQAAIDKVLSKDISLTEASTLYNISKSTLHSRFNKKSVDSLVRSHPRLNKFQWTTDDEKGVSKVI